MTAAPLRQILLHDRLFLAAGLGMVVALAWGWLLAGAGMSMGGALIVFAMWWIMMIAMMLPSAAPVILLAAALNRRADPARPPYGATGAFTAGYLLGWGLFSVAAVGVQMWLARIDLLSDMLVIRSDFFNGGILVAAGIWQFTPVKNACLQHCRSPVQFLTQHRRPDNTGALLMGLRHGLYCVGCCWFLMLLLFVGGVMNLLWIAGLAIYVWMEKTLPAGSRLSRITGFGLVTAGIVLMV
jgi:predicted metal-binding membrane protein